jgi:hypothetical protein
LLIPSSFTSGTAFISGRKIRRSHPSHHSPLPVGRLFAANGSLLSLQPADLLAPLTDPTPLALCRLGLLLRSFRQERSLSPPFGMTTVATGQVLLAGSSPAGLAASFAAPSGSATILSEPGTAATARLESRFWLKLPIENRSVSRNLEAGSTLIVLTHCVAPAWGISMRHAEAPGHTTTLSSK